MIFRLNILLSGYYVKLEIGNPSGRLGFWGVGSTDVNLRYREICTVELYLLLKSSSIMSFLNLEKGLL